MLKILKRLWKENEGKVKIRSSGSAYTDGNTLVLVKNKVWVRGPILISHVPFARFSLNDLNSIQEFLVEILTSPIERDLSEFLTNDKSQTKQYLAKLGVRSLRQAVEKYKHVHFEDIDGALVVTTTARDYNAKAWIEEEKKFTETGWMLENRGAKAVIEALTVSK